MIAFARRAALPLLLAAVCVWLSAGIAREVQRLNAPAPVGDQPAERAAPAAEAGTGRGEGDEGAPIPGLPPLDAFAAVTDQPLFHPTRQPAPPKALAARAPTNAAAAKPYDLAGVLISGRRRIALLRDTTNNRLLRVEAGATIADWQVETITATGLTLTRNGDPPLELRLPDRGLAPPGPGRPAAGVKSPADAKPGGLPIGAVRLPVPNAPEAVPRQPMPPDDPDLDLDLPPPDEG